MAMVNVAGKKMAAIIDCSVQPGRVRVLKEGSTKQTGPVVYWMFRDQRLRDNWALIYAIHQANKANVPVAVVFNLFDQFLGAKARQVGFMLKEKFRKCKDEICLRVGDSVAIHEVDAHNVVPIWVASEKLEYSARTLRGKINKRLPDYLIDFPVLQPPCRKWVATANQLTDWESLFDEVARKGKKFLKLNGACQEKKQQWKVEQLERAQTADPLWNASQLEMVYQGKMHGFMRMYWAKKILEWTKGPEEALAISIYLNDKYELDGRDPNGYVGCMWSICGVHDQGWKERQVFGKIRYMNYAGCKRKFDVDGYIAYVKRIVSEIKKRKAETQLGGKTKQLRVKHFI
ncbi:hypothetical protein GH714_029483 [Hevea brasiliensis]|uniref:Deoxyribodipyrimidine photo-lyase n=1 Tax=Hevea brasiliensis TaxID=3981 RepID=A0A6A6LG12_HEVBR|nr:hypothetical protein GH714_029483 [Hevea brasiliensis]